MLDEDIQLSSEQQNAVELCCDMDERIVCVTGGAGTGKTTILREAYRETQKLNKRVGLCAPTGRASKRIEEATGLKSQTIHRLLEFPKPDEVLDSDGKLVFGEPKRNPNNPLPIDVLYVDESSMIATKLNRQLIDALPRSACIRYFGDKNQLPPIDAEVSRGGKSVFERMLIEKPTVSLSYNFRSGDNLIENANRILRGSIPQRGDKFEIIYTSDALGTLREIATDEYQQTSHQVITPKRVHKGGAIHLSAALRTKFNLNQGKNRVELERWNDKDDPIVVLQDDKVIWTKNDYVLNIMNGELGIVEAIEDGSLELIFDDNRTIVIPPSVKGPFGHFYDPRKSIDLAYCMTTHKSQGSEFDEVIFVMTKASMWMLNRNNFYTGVTRAKKRVTVICDRKAMEYAMRRPR